MHRSKIQSSPKKQPMQNLNSRKKTGRNSTFRIALLGGIALMIHYSVFRNSFSSSTSSLSSVGVGQEKRQSVNSGTETSGGDYYGDTIEFQDSEVTESPIVKSRVEVNDPSVDESPPQSDFKAPVVPAETPDLYLKRPEVAWLMSFPNSGTSYTLSVVRRSTQTTTATNYGREKMYEESSVSYHPLHPEGPFIHKLDLKLPSTYILTKTHCGGYCSDCPPRLYIINKEDFQTACLSGKSEDKDGNREAVSYDIDAIRKAVYLIRNPFDNIVSRFHLIHNEKVKKEKSGNDDATKWLKEHPRDEKGFQKWCQATDKKYEKHEKEAFPQALQYPGILCQSEIIKYIQWHNLAAEILEDNEIPIHLIHYEDYKYHFDDTLEGTLDFLQLSNKGELKDFHLSDYSIYFSEDEREPSIKLIEELATASTLEKMQRYIKTTSSY